MKNRLNVLRAERGWSQAELAKRLSVSRQTVNAIENGRYDPSLPLAFAIGRVFESSIESIFSPQSVEPSQTVGSRFQQSTGPDASGSKTGYR